HHRSEPVESFVAVEGRGEPRVVDPGPHEDEHREPEAEQRAADVAFGEQVRCLLSGDAECDDEGRAEQQFQGCRDPVGPAGVPAPHGSQAMRERRRHIGLRGRHVWTVIGHLDPSGRWTVHGRRRCGHCSRTPWTPPAPRCAPSGVPARLHPPHWHVRFWSRVSGMRTNGAPSNVVRVGLIGGDRFVHKMTDIARKSGHPNLRLIPGPFLNESDARSAQKIAGDVDVLLYAGPLPYDLTFSEVGDLGVPSTFVPTGGPALHASLVKVQNAGIDPRRVSIDSMATPEIADAFTEVGLSARQTHAMPYAERFDLAAYRDFHLNLHRNGRTSGAITTIPNVQQELAEAGVPVELME